MRAIIIAIVLIGCGHAPGSFDGGAPDAGPAPVPVCAGAIGTCPPGWTPGCSIPGGYIARNADGVCYAFGFAKELNCDDAGIMDVCNRPDVHYCEDGGDAGPSCPHRSAPACVPLFDGCPAP